MIASPRVDRRRIDRFELDFLIQRGGMGEVWRATDTQSGAAVAVKLTRDGADLDRFAREADVLASLSHPGIVRHLAHGIHDGRGFMAMEWLTGEDLAARLRREPIPTSAALSLVRRIADALGSAHAQGIVHRDLKPGNIFLVDCDLENVRLIDFGVARVEEAPRTTAGMVIGTVGYMAPEQASGQRDLDARADIFALGCILYECIARQAPYSGRSAEAVLVKLMFSAPPKLSHAVPDIPADVDWLVSTMLAKARTERPATAEALAQLIDGILGGRALTERASTTIGASERRVTTILLWREEVSPPLHASESRSDTTVVLARTGVTPHDPHTVERLVDGTSCVRLSRLGTPRDHVVAACRRSLALLVDHPSASVAIATDYTEDEDASAEGPAMARARGLLRHVSPGHIGLDATSALLAEQRFDLEANTWGSRLLGPSKTLLAESTLEGPIVGRERELGMLERGLDDASSGMTSILVVLGEAGMGKTALSLDFQRRMGARQMPCRVVQATAEGLDVSVPYALLRSLLREADELLADASRGTSPAFQAIRTHSTPAQDDLVFELKTWLAALAERSLGVVLLHDIHWADEPSIRALTRALAECDDTQLLVVLSGRPGTSERFGKLLAPLGSIEMTLRPLSAKAAKLLVARAAGVELSDDVQAEIIHRGQGSPYVLQELVRAAKSGSMNELPAGVLGVVQANVDRLAPHVRRLLRAASVLGQRFTIPAAMAVLGEGAPIDPEGAMAASVEVDVIRLETDGSYAFRHSLTHEAVYAMLPDVDRAAAHARAARWLAEADRTEPSVMAHHFARAGDRDRAIEAFLAAAREAAMAGDRGAIERIEAEIKALDPDCPARAHVLHQLAKNGLGGRPEARAAAARSALAMLTAPSAERVALYVEFVYAELTEPCVAEAVDEIERAIDAGVIDERTRLTALDRIHNAVGAAGLERARNRVHQAITKHGEPHVPLTYWLLVTRQLERNCALAAERLELANATTAPDTIHLQIWYAYLLLQLGRLDEARTQTEACALRLRLSRSYDAASVIMLRCGVAEASGDYGSALRHAEEAVHLSRALSGPDDRETVRMTLRRADLLRRVGRHANVIQAVAEAEPGLRAFQGLRPIADANLACALSELGQRDEALGAARRGLSFLHDGWSFDGGAFRPRTTLARALMAAGVIDEAKAAATNALGDVTRYLDRIGTPDHRRLFLASAPGAADTVALGRELGLDIPTA